MKKAARLTLVAAIAIGAASSVLAQGAAAVKMDKAALAAEIQNDQRVVLVPGAGKRFLWVTATASGAAQSLDLTKVVLAAGSETSPLIGVDSAWGGDPKQFSMIARASSKDGRTLEPLEESRSTGDVAFAFTPGKNAVLKVLRPPQSFCLLFAVPETFRTGQISGLGAKPIPLPALTADARP
jgi:hypothetical protein